MSAPADFKNSRFKPLPVKPLPELSDAEKLVATALWSWLRIRPRATPEEFEDAFRRAKRLAETSR